MRRYVTYGGKNLVSCDISCSQPFFSLAIINALFDIKDRGKVDPLEFKKTLLKTIAIEREEQRRMEPLVFAIMWEECFEDIDYQSFEAYKNDVITGKLYDRILSAYNDRNGVIKTRKWIKTEVFKVFFGKSRETKVQIVFKSLYPLVHKLFEIIKRDDHSRMAVLLQSIEAQIVIKVICKRISRENSSLPIFTIHDSIVTAEGNEGYIKAIMEEEILRLVGSKPTIKIEPWTNN